MTVSEKLRYFRKTKKMTQTEFAKEVGSTKKTIFNYENGGEMKVGLIMSIKNRFPSFDILWFFGDKKEPGESGQLLKHEMTVFSNHIKLLESKIDLTDEKLELILKILQEKEN